MRACFSKAVSLVAFDADGPVAVAGCCISFSCSKAPVAPVAPVAPPVAPVASSSPSCSDPVAASFASLSLNVILDD